MIVFDRIVRMILVGDIIILVLKIIILGIIIVVAAAKFTAVAARGALAPRSSRL